MILDTREIDGVTVIGLKETDRFNSFITQPVKERLTELFKKPNVKLAFDLGGIKFIDSSGFAVFLTALKESSNNNGQFKIFNVQGEVMELFKVLKLHHIFEIYDELDACLRSFKP
jgi:anti-anti-sigma factor